MVVAFFGNSCPGSWLLFDYCDLCNLFIYLSNYIYIRINEYLRTHYLSVTTEIIRSNEELLNYWSLIISIWRTNMCFITNFEPFEWTSSGSKRNISNIYCVWVNFLVHENFNIFVIVILQASSIVQIQHADQYIKMSTEVREHWP